MHFLAPGFALLTALFGVPILIHLIGRRRARVRQFAALELLLRSQKRVARRTKVRQILLLLVRALAIAVVPLILAKPFVEAASDLPAAIGDAQSAVIIVDDSLSMSRVADGRALLNEAQSRARQIVAALGSDAEAALLLGSRGGGAPVAELTADRARLNRAIDAVVPTRRSTDLSGALKRAAQILSAAARPERRIYLVSDLAAHGFDHDAPWAAGRGPDLVRIDVTGGKSVPNHAVTELRVEAAPHLGPRGVRITAEVASFGAAITDLPITLRVDGKPAQKGLVSADAETRVQKRFYHAFSRDDDAIGAHDVTVELTPDGLASDDTRPARLEIRRDVRVLLVDGDPRTARRDDELFYLETALRPGDRDDSQLQVTTVSADDLGRTALADFDVVFLCNVKAGFDAAALREFVQKGGGLFVSMGDNVDADAYDAALGNLLPQPLQGTRTVGKIAGAHDDGETPQVGDGERLGRVEPGHPVLAPLGVGPSSETGLKAARFARYLLFRPSAEGAHQVLLRFEGGAPALVEGKLGEGRVLVFASTLDRDWNDLPIQPAFLPLVQQSARYLARAPLEEAEAPLVVGQRHDIVLSTGDLRIEVALPSGARRLFDKERVVGRRVLGFTETEEPGIYHVSAAGSDGVMRPRAAATFVVTLDPTESDPTPLGAERLAQLKAGGGARISAEPPRRRVELWHALGAGLLLLLLGEALLLRRK